MSKNLPPDKIPLMAKGSVIPYNILNEQLKEAKEKERIKTQRKHDFRIVLFSFVAGGLSGFLTSAILLHLQGLL